MGKRTIRIQQHELRNQLPAWQGKEIHLVTADQRTWFGKLIRVDAEGAVIQDVNAAWYNRKRHSHQFPWDSLREAIADQVSDY